ncbi:regulator of G-protein signaling 6-like [Adelges cooleyi]|uniref:regulator of G-protein signaling 6-like n=1 Tax=Adelges cooleyi TaxID=133065 RepID=UPI00217F366B|nr:regulator of G-protein signaling 6-like [Adelges cooleyi]
MSADIHVVNRVKFLTGKFCKAVFEDYELLNWISMQIDVHNEAEARHLATLLVYYGYVLPVHDRFLPVQRNGEFYRFQIPKFYPSISYEIRDEEYAVHLNVRVMSSSKLARYEKENLAKLKEKFSDHWDEILRCAKYRSTTFQEMDDTDSELFQFRERAFWNVHRPKPGTFHSTEKDYRKLKAYTPQNSTETDETNDDTTREDVSEPLNLDRRNISQSHPGNNHTPYCVQYAAYDPFVTHPISYNYWLVKKIGIWKTNNDQLALSSCRTKLWAFSLRDILSDPVGKDNFKMFLEKEFSYENLK